MQLGVVMMGTGVYAAASVGVVQALMERGIEPYAVCGMQAGAWPAALLLSGRDAQGLSRAVVQAAAARGRLLRMSLLPGLRLTGGRRALGSGRGVERLLLLQLGQQLMPLCPRRGMLLCRSAQTGQRVVFATRAFGQEQGAQLSMQVSLGFAARAAVTLPPFLPPVIWMGSALLPVEDVPFACRQLLLMGAQRVLVIEPCPSACGEPDAVTLTGMLLQSGERMPQDERVGVLRVALPPSIPAHAVSRLMDCVRAGYDAAGRELEDVLRRMGMGICRVLPFPRSML